MIRQEQFAGSELEREFFVKLPPRLSFKLMKKTNKICFGTLFGDNQFLRKNSSAQCDMIATTDYGRQMKPFIIEIHKFWAWADKLGKTISTHILHYSINHCFYKKLRLYVRIPNIYLGLGFEFEFGPQRIKYLLFSLDVSIVRDSNNGV